VRVGEPVQLVWSRGGVRIIVEGLAVNAATLGEEVRVRLADRRGKARGIVTGPGMADLTGSITR
jgi:flagella basal body P-ring formation protein FlgA